MTTLAVRVRPALPPLAARGVAFAALCGFGLLHWMLMVDPAAQGSAVAGLGVALVVAAVATRPVPFWAAVVIGILGATAAAIAGGLPVADLWPTHWPELGRSLGDGIGSVGAARIPYTGSDPDLRLVIPIGGTLLAFFAASLVFDGKRLDGGQRIGALALLIALYAVPAIALDLRAEFLRGAVLTVLVLLYLRLERVSQRELAAAAGLAALAAVAALAVAPALDTRRPWFNYEEFAQHAASARATSFSWDHDYAALPWPRDGSEMLRVESPRRAYWKVDTLDSFDGATWLENPTHGAPAPLAAQNHGVTAENLARWTFPIEVSVRGLRSPSLALAGMPQSVTMADREPFPVASGVWSAGRGIHRADSYRARVYVPSPSRAELEAAVPAFYPDPVLQDLTFEANRGPVGESIEVFVREFKARPFLVTFGPESAVPVLRHSNLRRIYRLSRRLLAGAATPYDYVQAVQRHLRPGFTYDETPPRAARTLDGFLFDAKSGFCQQYSGAMALLLRMGGVPARVATGFAPGSYDSDAKRYIVRDLDAHSWVEAWFEGIGWVDFDPTPPNAPPRSQAFGAAASAANGDLRDRGTKQIADAPFKAPDSPWDEVALAALGCAAMGGVAGLLALRRTRERIELSELERALRGAGEACGPGTTLTALEARLPAAADYLRALRAERYAGGAGPTPAHRRVLRRALSRGRGPLARGRTWLALRPRVRG